jgi:hypothetical protein
MTRRLLNLLTVLSLLLSVAVLGCDRSPQQVATTRSAAAAADDANQDEAEPESQPAPPPEQPLQPDDFPVFNAVLTHFAADAEVAKIMFPRPNRRQIVLHRETSGGRWGLRGHHVRRHYGEGNLPEDALDDMELRNNGALAAVTPDDQYAAAMKARQGADIRTFAPSHPDVVLGDLEFPASSEAEWDDAMRKAYPLAKAHGGVSLPGYTADGRRAVVEVGFGPVPHRGQGIYLLEKDSTGTWRVVWRKLKAFL